ncbi:MAG: sugar ABC transporter permease [Chloroflexi bacterium]|nr:sugar ABC transporter permease [Chloroflexota bacterium]
MAQSAGVRVEVEAVRWRFTLARVLGVSSPLGIHRALWGYIFLSPWAIGLLVFVLGPIVASAYFGFTEYDVLSPPRWIGIANYTKAFTDDELFWPSLGRTFKYSLVVVPVGMVGSLILAMLLNQGVPGTNIFRTLFFLPSLTPAVALALLWKWLLHPTVGPVNVMLGWLGISGPAWMASKDWALPALIMISLWGGIGGGRMLIFLAGLQGVPQELYEAAEIDGAGTWHKFWHVTLPMISPTMFFNLILGVIGALQVFTLSYVATLGGPSYATWFYALHIYRQAFEYFRMGYGSALAWIFVVILLIFTYFQLNLSRRWVYYAGE